VTAWAFRSTGQTIQTFVTDFTAPCAVIANPKRVVIVVIYCASTAAKSNPKTAGEKETKRMKEKHYHAQTCLSRVKHL